VTHYVSDSEMIKAEPSPSAANNPNEGDGSHA
jgi:hypothetical protein